MADEVFTPIKCTDPDFLTSARLYRRELLTRPTRRLQNYLDLFTIRRGVRFEEKVGEVDADIEFGNYNPKNRSEVDPSFKFRTLRTFFGSVIRDFDPNKYFKTLYGSSITVGDGLKGVEIARLVLNILTKKLGDRIFAHLFDASHVDGGNKTVELFNGFDTITAKEIADGNLSVANKNLFEFSAAIDNTNAVDFIREFCKSADDFLMEKERVNLVMPRYILDAYLEDYKATTGAIPYNTSFKQIHPEGFENVFFAPMAPKKNSEFLQLTTKDNMLIGVNQLGDEEKIVVEKHDVFLLTFAATLFFGTEFESLNPDRILVGKLFSSNSTPDDSEKTAGSEQGSNGGQESN